MSISAGELVGVGRFINNTVWTLTTGVHSVVYNAPSFAFIASLQYSVKCNGIVETGEREKQQEEKQEEEEL